MEQEHLVWPTLVTRLVNGRENPCIAVELIAVQAWSIECHTTLQPHERQLVGEELVQYAITFGRMLRCDPRVHKITKMPDCSAGDELLALRRDMVWRGLPVREEFHATEDRQVVRDEVYNFISGKLT